jgi:ATP-dependent DNA helicase RecG
MSRGRPEILFPLFAGVESLDGVGPKTAQALAALGLPLVRDLLFTLPSGHVDRRLRPSIRGADLPCIVTVEVTVGRHFPPRRKGQPWRITVRDAEDEFQLVFFHARDEVLRDRLPAGARRIVSGMVEFFENMAQMVHPDHILRPEEAPLPDFEPVYPAGAGLGQRQVGRAVATALTRAPDLPEWHDPARLTREGWPAWRDALRSAHLPGEGAGAAAAAARRRLAYDEVLAHQLTLALGRAHMRRGKGRVTKGDGHLSARVVAALPFRLTGAQERAVAGIRADMAAPGRMNRLLQGDVGSGKTLVAFLAMLTAVEAGGQAALMAPTEILARQHHSRLAPLAATAGVPVALMTGRDRAAEREATLAGLADGRLPLVVGTHALVQEEVAFADLRLAIVDEQHRFGVRQRHELGLKGQGTDILVMTATPIPRSLALAGYGDLDLTVIDEKPPGRRPIETVLASSERLDEIVRRLGAALDRGRQAYWVCPLVEDSELVDLTAAEERAKALRAALGAGRVGLVHGRLAPAEKDAAMADFVAGRTALLVATTVIEVGVDVPGASIMVIEQAERFGLAQLHQLRGRVGRGEEASTCVLLYDPPLGTAAEARLRILRETEDGFRIAEEDLRLRGAGDLIGHRQAGLPRFRIADLEREPELLQMAHDDARLVLARDPDLAGPRAGALRTLLYLLGQDEAVRLLSVG